MPVAMNFSEKICRAMFSPEEAEPQIPEQMFVTRTIISGLAARPEIDAVMNSKPGWANLQTWNFQRLS